MEIQRLCFITEKAFEELIVDITVLYPETIENLFNNIY